VNFLARKTIHVRAVAARTDRVSIRIIPVAGEKSLAAVHQVRDVSVAVGMIEVVSVPIAIAARVAVRTGEQAPYASGTFE
jgi:hypothetical protein